MVAVMTGSVRQAMARVRKTPKYRHLVKRLQAEQAARGKNGAAPARKRPSAKPKKVRLGGGDRHRLARGVARACLHGPCGTAQEAGSEASGGLCRQCQGMAVMPISSRQSKPTGEGRVVSCKPHRSPAMGRAAEAAVDVKMATALYTLRWLQSAEQRARRRLDSGVDGRHRPVRSPYVSVFGFVRLYV